MTRKANYRNTQETIEARLDKTGDCWTWTGQVDVGGYGLVSYQNKQQKVHRLMFEWYNGLIHEGNIILHSCDNPPCANPGHLRQGTHSDNMQDCIKRNRKYVGSMNPNAKLTDYQVKAIRGLHQAGLSGVKLALLFNVSRRTIHKIVTGKSWEVLNSVEGVTELGDTGMQISANKLNTVGIEATK